MKSCLIIEDQAECRRWLTGVVLTAFPHCRIEESTSLREALAKTEQSVFDLILIDLALPDGCGLDALRHFKRKSPQAVCVIVTIMGEDGQIVAALSAGAQGYLLKEQPAALLSRQLAELSAGVPALSPSIARRIMEHFERTGPTQSAGCILTNRESQTLALVGRGLRNAEVAKQLDITQHTAASHI